MENGVGASVCRLFACCYFWIPFYMKMYLVRDTLGNMRMLLVVIQERGRELIELLPNNICERQ